MAEQLTTNGNASIRDLRDGDPLDAVLCVRERSLRKKRNGDDFLTLTLSDASGEIDAVSWDDARERFDIAEPGAIVRVCGPFSLSERYGPKVTVQSIRPAAASEIDLVSLTRTGTVPLDRLEADLRSLLATIQDPWLGQLLERLLGPESQGWNRFREAPAAKYYHQAYVHGLLEHTLSVAQAVSAAAAFFAGLDRDVAVTGALVHDIGKLEAYNDDPLAIDLTDAGRLEGEIPLGYYLVRREIERIEGFPEALARSVLHIVLSHHGTHEHGSPVIPATREATLVHAMDNLGGKLGSFDRIEAELADGESWSKFDRGIASAAYFGARAA